MSEYGVFSGLYFPVFGLNTEIYFVNLHIQSEYKKIRTRKKSVFGHFSRSVGKYVISKNYKYHNLLTPTKKAHDSVIFCIGNINSPRKKYDNFKNFWHLISWCSVHFWKLKYALAIVVRTTSPDPQKRSQDPCKYLRRRAL